MAIASVVNPVLTEDLTAASKFESEAIPILRRSLHDEAIEHIRDMIVEGLLVGGDWINEPELCRQLQISRTPLREALKVLATEGLIELVPRRGARVARLSTQEMEDLFEALSGIEGLAAELAATRMSAADFEKLRDMQVKIENLHAARDRLTYFHENRALHLAIVHGSGNSALIKIHAQLIARVSRARYQAILSDQRWDDSIAEHAQILAALEKRDGPLACERMRHHIAHTGKVVLASVGKTSP